MLLLLTKWFLKPWEMNQQEKKIILLIYKDTRQWIYSLETFSNYSNRIYSLTASYDWLKVLIHVLEIEDWSLSFF